MYPCKVVSREINHSVNCMYYRRLFGAKWQNSRVTCSLKYEGLIVQNDMFGRNLPKPNNFIINTKRQNSINCQ
jgi:hypothetical protein